MQKMKYTDDELNEKLLQICNKKDDDGLTFVAWGDSGKRIAYHNWLWSATSFDKDYFSLYVWPDEGKNYVGFCGNNKHCLPSFDLNDNEYYFLIDLLEATIDDVTDENLQKLFDYMQSLGANKKYEAIMDGDEPYLIEYWIEV